MKRRRWWFIALALSLALVAACVFGWKWSERPPYPFMAKYRLIFVDQSFLTPDGADLTYALVGSSADPISSAKLEVHDLTLWEDMRAKFNGVPCRIAMWSRIGGPEMEVWQFPGGQDPQAVALRWKYPPLPAGCTSLVRMRRTATPFDRLRIWLFGFRYEGNRP